MNGSKISLNIYLRWFEYIITLSIIINTINISVFDYSDRDSATLRNQVVDQIDRALTIIFILEAVLKIFGMGFIMHIFSYLRQSWNIIDFIIVISG